MYATVQRIESIRPHPDETRTKIEVIKLRREASDGVELVTGKHYRVGLLGIYLKAGCWIPGWLAEDLWLVGKKRGNEPFEVRSINIFGVESPGLFCGAEYMNDGSEASAERYKKLEKEGGRAIGTNRQDGKHQGDWITWPRWRSHWTEGMVLDGYLGVRPADGGWNLSMIPAYGGAPIGGSYPPSTFDPSIASSVGTFNPAGPSSLSSRVIGSDPTLAAPVLTDPLILEQWPTTYCAVCGGVKSNPPSQFHSVWCSCTGPQSQQL